jgi:cyclase
MKRSFFHCVSGILLSVFFVSAGFAQQAAPAVSVEKIRGNIYQIKGGAGANTGFVIGEKNVVVIDAKMTEEAGRQMVDAIKRLTPLPIKWIIITHSDQDHVNGLVGLPQGVPVIAQENTRVHMDKAFRSSRERAYLPNVTFSEKLTVYQDAGSQTGRVDLLYFGPAHTDGDAVVYFPDEKVAFLGDLIFIGRDQLIHRHKNGSSGGLVRTLRSVMNLDADIFVSGHSDPVTRQTIQEHIRNIEDKQAKIAQLVKEGNTLDQIKKIYGIDVQGEGSRWPSLVEIIYRELVQAK